MCGCRKRFSLSAEVPRVKFRRALIRENRCESAAREFDLVTSQELPLRPKPLVLIILDGWGYRAETKANAIALARKPTYDRLLREYPNTLIHTSGPFVGLPEGPDGQQRSWPSEHWRRAHRAHGHHAHRPDDPERRILLASRAGRSDEDMPAPAAASCISSDSSPTAACTRGRSIFTRC